ncbi:hypothetical protein JCM14713_28430 [Desulfomicrobium salsuginis]
MEDRADHICPTLTWLSSWFKKRRAAAMRTRETTGPQKETERNRMDAAPLRHPVRTAPSVFVLWIWVEAFLGPGLGTDMGNREWNAGLPRLRGQPSDQGKLP